MAPTAKLTTGPGVPRAETIREQFCNLHLSNGWYLGGEKDGGGYVARLEKRDRRMAGFGLVQVAKERGFKRKRKE